MICTVTLALLTVCCSDGDGTPPAGDPTGGNPDLRAQSDFYMNGTIGGPTHSIAWKR